MYLAFVLSMPNVGSWNGQWSGSDDYYATVITFNGKTLERGQEILKNESFYYNFGDGWSASVSVVEVNVYEARKIRRKSKGFCGYDWMVSSIINSLKITVKEPTS